MKMHIIKDSDPYANSAIIVLFIVLFCVPMMTLEFAIIVKVLLFLIFTSALAYVGLFTTRYYLADETGITVVWYGFIKHRFTWDEFKYVRVHVLHRSRHRSFPYIVCSHRQLKKLWTIDRFIFHPMSACVFEFSPERMEVLENYGISINYYSRYGEVMRLYEEDLKNWGIR